MNFIKSPKIILISSLLTWGGRKYHVPIGGTTNEFLARVPVPSEVELYKLENKFHACFTQTGVRMTIVGVGLLYGGNGYDFHEVFKYVFSVIFSYTIALCGTLEKMVKL